MALKSDNSFQFHNNDQWDQITSKNLQDLSNDRVVTAAKKNPFLSSTITSMHDKTITTAKAYAAESNAPKLPQPQITQAPPNAGNDKNQQDALVAKLTSNASPILQAAVSLDPQSFKAAASPLLSLLSATPNTGPVAQARTETNQSLLTKALANGTANIKAMHESLNGLLKSVQNQQGQSSQSSTGSQSVVGDDSASGIALKTVQLSNGVNPAEVKPANLAANQPTAPQASLLTPLILPNPGKAKSTSKTIISNKSSKSSSKSSSSKPAIELNTTDPDATIPDDNDVKYSLATVLNAISQSIAQMYDIEADLATISQGQAGVQRELGMAQVAQMQQYNQEMIHYFQEVQKAKEMAGIMSIVGIVLDIVSALATIVTAGAALAVMITVTIAMTAITVADSQTGFLTNGLSDLASDIVGNDAPTWLKSLVTVILIVAVAAVAQGAVTSVAEKTLASSVANNVIKDATEGATAEIVDAEVASVANTFDRSVGAVTSVVSDAAQAGADVEVMVKNVMNAMKQAGEDALKQGKTIEEAAESTVQQITKTLAEDPKFINITLEPAFQMQLTTSIKVGLEDAAVQAISSAGNALSKGLKSGIVNAAKAAGKTAGQSATDAEEAAEDAINAAKSAATKAVESGESIQTAAKNGADEAAQAFLASTGQKMEESLQNSIGKTIEKSALKTMLKEDVPEIAEKSAEHAVKNSKIISILKKSGNVVLSGKSAEEADELAQNAISAAMTAAKSAAKAGKTAQQIAEEAADAAANIYKKAGCTLTEDAKNEMVEAVKKELMKEIIKGMASDISKTVGVGLVASLGMSTGAITNLIAQLLEDCGVDKNTAEIIAMVAACLAIIGGGFKMSKSAVKNEELLRYYLPQAARDPSKWVAVMVKIAAFTEVAAMATQVGLSVEQGLIDQQIGKSEALMANIEAEQTDVRALIKLMQKARDSILNGAMKETQQAIANGGKTINDMMSSLSQMMTNLWT